MLFLLRLTFWIMVICLLLPGSSEDNRHLMASAEKTVTDVRGFCLRNADVCDDGRKILASTLTRLKNGAELIQAWIAESEKQPDGDPMIREGKDSRQDSPRRNQGSMLAPQDEPTKPVMKWQNSLNPADKQLPWRGPTKL